MSAMATRTTRAAIVRHARASVAARPFATRAGRGVPAAARHISNKSAEKNAATATRPVPSPAFNQAVTRTGARKSVYPLDGRAPKYDDSLVGMSGGQIFHEMMLRHKVDTVFGYPGGAILPVFDAIYNSKHFEFILPRHEQGAGHMAEGYARVTGKPGIVLVTSGPGATNVVTPMADALSDGVPMIVFTGQVPTSAIGTDAFQEADVVGISRACTKWNVMVKDVEELPRRINEAFEIAMSGRPGPVLVDLPKDVTASILRDPIPTHTVIPQTPAPRSLGTAADAAKHEQLIDNVARLVNMAKKPLIFAGAGVVATDEGTALLRELSDKASIPVTTTLMGLGAIDETDPKALQMIGMHGSGYANLAMQDADLIVGLGVRFDDRVTGHLALFAPQARAAALEGRGGIVHFEIMPKNINKVVQATYAVEGYVDENLRELLPKVKSVSMAERKSWFDQINDWKKRFPFAYKQPAPGAPIKPQEVIEELDAQTEQIKDKVIIATGVGQHQMWAAQHFRFKKPRSFVSSGGLGTMGYGVPAAIGAQVAKPDHVVIDIDGDASFSMTAMELATAAQFDIPVKFLLLNNEEQGMVTQWQTLFYEKRYAHTHQKNPDFPKLAESMGVKGIKLTDRAELPAKMKEFLEHKGPVLLEVMVTPKEHVYPMVPAGKGLHEFIVDK